MKFCSVVALFDLTSFYPLLRFLLSFDPSLFDPLLFDPMAENPKIFLLKTERKFNPVPISTFFANIDGGRVFSTPTYGKESEE